ncbi:hypothetical protein RJT34_02031 [Clitoria ternatea]|uniref:DUF8003 domain-containing protein n=1 Tax=Clitoria ternatea TaxID=43366 RepID=A0AAN9Q052_CLITE
MEEELLMSDSKIKASRTIRLILLSFGFPIDLTSFVRQHSVWEYPVGTYKNVSGSDRALCNDCPPQGLPHRVLYIPVRGAVAETPCLYKCISDRYHMPNCYTSAEFYTEFLIWKPIVGHRRAWSSIVGIYHLVAATSDLMLAYLDFILGGDEKRSDLPPHLHQRFPMCIIFGGDGSYMSLFSLHSDNILTSIMS